MEGGTNANGCSLDSVCITKATQMRMAVAINIFGPRDPSSTSDKPEKKEVYLAVSHQKLKMQTAKSSTA